MAYVPNPSDPTQPVDSVFASTAAAEFRALKGYIQGIVAGSGQLSGYRNIIRNGDFSVNQRAVGAVATNGAFIADGWALLNTTVARMPFTRIGSTPPFPQAIQGIVNAVGAPGAGDAYGITQVVEGFDAAQLMWGTASAKVVNLSFWVASNTPGTYCASVRNNASARSFVAPFTVNLANVWEFKTIQIPGDTAGVWPIDNNGAMRVNFCPASGSTFLTATPNTWLAGNFIGTSTMTQLTNTAAGTFAIAEAQLEQAAFATPFEHQDWASRFARAQRYYQTSYDYGVAAGSVSVGGGSARAIGNDANNALIMHDFLVPMRAAPNAVIYQPATGAISTFRNTQTGASIGLSTGFVPSAKGGYVLVTAGGVTVNSLYEFHYVADAEM